MKIETFKGILSLLGWVIFFLGASADVVRHAVFRACSHSGADVDVFGLFRLRAAIVHNVADDAVDVENRNGTRMRKL